MTNHTKKTRLMRVGLAVVVLAGIIIQLLSLKLKKSLDFANLDQLRCHFVACATNKTMLTVEIFYLPHPPAQAVVNEVEKILAEYPRYKVAKYSFEDQNSQTKIRLHGLTGHIPVAIVINGKNKFSLDGREIYLKNFPKDNAFIPTLEGSWSYQDLATILAHPENL